MKNNKVIKTNKGSVGRYMSIPIPGKYSRSGTEMGVRKTINNKALSILKNMNKKIIIANGKIRSIYFSSEMNHEVMKI